MGREEYLQNFFTKEDYLKCKKVAEKLSNGKTVENEKSSIILNSALIAIENGADKSDINKLAIASLCKKSI